MATTTPTFSTRNRVAPGALGRMSRNPAAPWRHLDPTVVLAATALTALGLLAIYSSTFAGLRAQGLPEASIMRRQLLNLKSLAESSTAELEEATSWFVSSE